MKLNLANIATVKVQGRNELHLKFNNDLDMAEAYARITRAELPASNAKADALHDSAYIAGLKAGYSLGVNEDASALQKAIDARDGYLKALAA